MRVIGNDHSPWVQAVLLGLHELGVEHTLQLSPPAEVFVRSGVLMPVAQLDQGDWMLDSERILVALGYDEVSDEDRRALQLAFGRGALARADSVRDFFHRFSFVRDDAPRLVGRLWHKFWGAFAMFYFCVLIRFLARKARRPTQDDLATQFVGWQKRLGDAVYFGGDDPDTVDLQLFGIVQMYASIPGPSYAVLCTHPDLERLRGWVSVMQARFASYAHLYTAPDFEPKRPAIVPALLVERSAFWAGLATMTLAFPVTVPLVFYFARRIRVTGMLREAAPQAPSEASA